MKTSIFGKIEGSQWEQITFQELWGQARAQAPGGEAIEYSRAQSNSEGVNGPLRLPLAADVGAGS